MADAAVRDDVWLRQFYLMHWASMVRLAGLLMCSSEQSEDIVQDCFVAVHRRRDSFNSDAHAAAYLRTSVVNACRSAHRHRKVVQRHVASGDVGSAAANPEAVTLAHQVSDEVMAALSRLPTRQREVLVLRYYSDASEVQIADTLHISTGSVKSHAHRGIESLRKNLASFDSEGI